MKLLLVVITVTVVVLVRWDTLVDGGNASVVGDASGLGSVVGIILGNGSGVHGSAVVAMVVCSVLCWQQWIGLGVNKG